MNHPRQPSPGARYCSTTKFTRRTARRYGRTRCSSVRTQYRIDTSIERRVGDEQWDYPNRVFRTREANIIQGGPSAFHPSSTWSQFVVNKNVETIVERVSDMQSDKRKLLIVSSREWIQFLSNFNLRDFVDLETNT